MAVNSYRFISMYIIIGLIITGLFLIKNQINNEDMGYSLNVQNKLSEIGQSKSSIISQSGDTTKANQYSLTNSYLNENLFGHNIASAFVGGFIPGGLIPTGYTVNPLENTVNWIVVLFQGFISFFAIVELYQIIIKSKVT